MRTVVATLLSLLMVGSAVAQTGLLLDRPWRPVEHSPLMNMRDGVAVSRYVFYGVGEGGSIAVSKDGGDVWMSLETQTGTAGYRDVTFDPNYGVVAVGEGGIVTFIKENDQPRSINFDANWNLTGVDVGNTVMFIVGMDDEGRPVGVRTEDMGETYEPLDLPLPDRPTIVTGVRYMSPLDAVIYGSVKSEAGVDEPFILITLDGGKTWSTSLSDSRGFTVTAVAGNSGAWVAVGVNDGDGPIGFYRSEDRGETWTFIEEPSLFVATDITRAEAVDFIAIALRVIDTGEEPDVVVSEVYSVDGGKNWNIRDIADEGGPLRLALGGDRLLGFGQPGMVFRRWYDRQPTDSGMVYARRILDVGAHPVNETSEIPATTLARNTSDAPLEITSMTLRDVLGITPLQLSGTIIQPGETFDLSVLYTPTTEGAEWGIIEISLSNGQRMAWPVHCTGYDLQNDSVVPAQPLIDLGNIKDMEFYTTRADVVVNKSSSPIQITGLGLEGDDILALAYSDAPDFPVTLAPGETFALDLVFEPFYKGVYTMQINVETSAGRVVVPVVAAVREEVFDNIIDLGTFNAGDVACFRFDFRHFLWNSAFTVNTLYGPEEPFSVLGASPLPFEGMPDDVITVDMNMATEEVGEFASFFSIPWSFDGLFDSRVDRRILLGTVKDSTTSVDEGVVTGGLTAYPSPTSGSLNVDIPQGTWTNVRIMDLNGSIVLSQAVNAGSAAASLDMSRLATGVYTVILEGANQSQTTRVTKY